MLLVPEMEALEEAQGSMPWPDHRCLTCGGTKTFRWRNPENYSEFVDWECDCKQQCALHAYLLHCGIQKAYQQLSWRDVEVDPRAVTIVRNYIDQAEPCVRAGLGLILHGDQGTGKTLLATLLLKHVLGLGIDGYFVPFPLMVELFTEGWRDAEKAAWFRKRIENVQVLVLDDIGKEHMQKIKTTEGDETTLRAFATSVVGRTFDAVIRHRVAAAKPTIITTNFDLDELRQSYGSNIFSLLSERSIDFRFEGENYRLTKAPPRLTEEMLAGATRPVVLA